MKEIMRSDWNYIVYQDEDGSIYFYITYGTSVIVSIFFKATKEEQSDFVCNVSFADQIAESVRNCPEKYIHRRVTPPKLR